MSQRSHRRVDVIILTATPPELAAVLKVDAGAVAGSSWEEATGPSGLPVLYRRFNGKSARPLRVAAAVAPDMGAPAAANTLLPLIEALDPRCIAMCGVCAGRRDKVQLGDVIAADRPYYHDTGKQLPGRVEQDLTTYKLRDDWKVAIERMDPVARFRGERWFHERPLTTQWRLYCAMVALRDEVPEPWTAVDPTPGGADQWPLIVAALRERKMLTASGRRLTKAGIRFVDDLLLRHRNELPDLSPTGTFHPFRLHVAPIGTGARVIEDEQIWTFVSQTMRKTLGIEMEAAAISEVAHRQRHRQLDWLVMKGVMDFADHGRDDHFKDYAARASAECLLWFLREHLATEPVAGFDDVLTPGTLALPTGDVAPSLLLAAPFAVVPWRQAGRDEVMAELDRWADDPSHAVAVRLLHAEGGVGKTRLAIEWLRRRRGEDGESDRRDVAGFLTLKPADDWLERLCGLNAPAMIAIDYAETRADLVGVLIRVAAAARASKPGREIRVLLLARSAGDWWEALLEHELALKVLLTTEEPLELVPLAVDTVEREAVFKEALVAFAKHRGRPVPRAQISAGDADFERVLYLHIAALAAVERSAEPAGATASAGSAVVLNASGLMDQILDHEQRFWLRNRHDGNRTAIPLARQIVAAATLRGGIASQNQAQQLCERLSGSQRTDAHDDLLTLLHDVYALDEGGLYLPGLQPDLLGEAMVSRVATRQADEKWIEHVVIEGDNTEAVGSAFTVLGRAAAVNASTISPWLAALFRTELALRALPALRAAKAVGQRTAFSPLGDLLADVLETDGTAAIARALTSEPIPFSTVSLRRVAEWRSRMQLADAPSGNNSDTLSERAALLLEWGLRLVYLGRREAALDAIRQAVETYRALVAKHPDAFLPKLAFSLNSLGNVLSELGQHDAALAVTSEAVTMYRALAIQHASFLPNLAMSLQNLGIRLNKVGQDEAALAATREAVETYRALATIRPNTFLPDLAMSLNNLGNHLSAVGQREAALDAAREAVQAYRALATKHPDAFLSELSLSLNSLGTRLSEDGQLEAALAATREAVELRRELAIKHPDAFLPNLATSLNNLGLRLSTIGQREDALDAMRKAVELRHALAIKHPDAFLPDFAMSLHNLGTLLSEVGKRQVALDVIRKAAELRRAISAKHPDKFLPDFAMSLHNLGVLLTEIGQREPALDATREALEVYRILAAKHPDAFLPGLAKTLNDLGNRLRAVGLREAALDAAREAVELGRALAAKSPDVFLPNLAVSLNSLGGTLRAVGQRETALATILEAVEIYRSLAIKHSDAFLYELAMSLHNCSLILSEAGQFGAALDAIREAVELRRALAAQHPDKFLPDLAISLDILARRLTETGDYGTANAASREAAEIRHTLQAKKLPDDEGGSA